METQTLLSTQSVWNATVEMPSFPPLTRNIECDVCIVGAGLGGLITAYLLQKENQKVCVLESASIGTGQTGFTTAHFTVANDDYYSYLEDVHGKETAHLTAQSAQAALDEIERIVYEEDINCDFAKVNGYLFTAPETSLTFLQDEVMAAHRAGLKDVATMTHAPIHSFNTGMALVYPDQIQLHPLKFLKALSQIITKRGGLIFTHSHVDEVNGGSDAYVTTRDGYTVWAKNIVVATNTPINDLFAIHTKQAAYRSYVLGFKIPKGYVTPALFWDTGTPYHYIRTQPLNDESDILIIGGEDHKTGQNKQPEDCFLRLEAWTRERFPESQNILFRWSGQVMEPVDGLAFLGHNPGWHKNVFVISGDSGNGMTSCTIGGMIIADQIMKRSNPWEKIYSPSRISFKTIGEYMKENLNTAAQYGDWLEVVPSREIFELGYGEGCVINDGIRKIAAYKNNEGHLELHSAVCTHLGGLVRWNSVEKSWDCPCHGSRFDCHGHVIEGPANKDLAPLKMSNTQQSLPQQERFL